MMSVERAFETLRRVNPVPDPAAFRAQLEAGSDRAAATMPGRQTMDTMTPTPEKAAPPPEKRTRRWVPAVAAAAAVVALLAVGTMLFRGDGVTPGPAATTQPTVTQPDESTETQVAATIEAATAYFQASAAGDVERARSLVAEGFRTDEAPNACRDLATLEWCLRMHEGYEFEYRNFDCAHTGPGSFVRCEGTFIYGVIRRTPTHLPGPEAFLVLFDDGGSIVRVLGTSTRDPAPEITDQDILDWQDEFDPWEEWIAFIERVDPDFAALNDRALWGALGPEEELGPEEAAEFFEKLAQYLDLYEAHAAEAHEAWLRDREEG